MEKFNMFDDKATFKDCKEYAIHDENNIKGFFGEYRWLSNFEPCKVIFEGLEYPSSENAYQAAKLIYNSDRELFQTLSPSKSKRIFREKEFNNLTEDWHNKKYSFMKTILIDKFSRNPELKKKLLETGDKYLEETNHWQDIFWGVFYKTGEGENNLGKILMELREKIKNNGIEF